ncbi:hypothetical protein ERO13_A03G045050v2 [Gossypium hirsutum]|uniref:Uncharacterized protein n=1 Tax=Gossypium tomentosum TaxID=34277 RepID=A0A5D2R2X4_GOSTO|nr:hypothetical protein ERO13_A03G045050v2 [Gossypium hirsutum]TYI35231.1 hypothetical protein ES332_A03G061700v1 [Gossypium tomentosum]
MFSWFYRVWMLENIFQRENILLDTGKIAFNLGKTSYRFQLCKTFSISSSSRQNLHKLLFRFLSSPLSQDLILPCKEKRNDL